MYQITFNAVLGTRHNKIRFAPKFYSWIFNTLKILLFFRHETGDYYWTSPARKRSPFKGIDQNIKFQLYENWTINHRLTMPFTKHQNETNPWQRFTIYSIGLEPPMKWSSVNINFLLSSFSKTGHADTTRKRCEREISRGANTLTWHQTRQGDQRAQPLSRGFWTTAARLDLLGRPRSIGFTYFWKKYMSPGEIKAILYTLLFLVLIYNSASTQSDTPPL